jgi:uncharacterized protein (DUF952 family)
MRGMRIYHVATLADWQQAKVSGSYTTSTYGASLAEVGFLHAAHRSQVPGVLERYYGDVGEPILVLEIETDLLDVPWREDDVDGESFPHIYGALKPAAVVGYHPPSRAAFERPPVPPRAPTPPLTLAFQGVACMLGLACLIFFVAALIETSRNADRMQPNPAPALLWTFTVVSAACALVALGVAGSGRTRHQAPPVTPADGARV